MLNILWSNEMRLRFSLVPQKSHIYIYWNELVNKGKFLCSLVNPQMLDKKKMCKEETKKIQLENISTVSVELSVRLFNLSKSWDFFSVSVAQASIFANPCWFNAAWGWQLFTQQHWQYFVYTQKISFDIDWIWIIQRDVSSSYIIIKSRLVCAKIKRTSKTFLTSISASKIFDTWEFYNCFRKCYETLSTLNYTHFFITCTLFRCVQTWAQKSRSFYSKNSNFPWAQLTPCKWNDDDIRARLVFVAPA